MSTHGRGRVPDAIVIGATKAGTTSLFTYLDGHPEVFMHPQKELRYFSDPERFALGPSWYRGCFADAGDRVAIESSNSYTRDPVYAGVAERVADLCPDIRLVYVVRDPFARLESHYRHRLATGREWRTPDDAIRSDRSYVAASMYGHQLQIHTAHTPIERIHVARAEQLADPTDSSRAELCRFLGIAHDTRPWPLENPTGGRPVAPAPLRRLYGSTGSERVARLGRRVAARLDRGPDAAAAEFALSAGLRSELADRFEADRQILTTLTSGRLR